MTSWGLNFLQTKWKQRWLPSLLTSKPWRKLWLMFRLHNVRPLLITSQYTINISLKFDKKFHIMSKHFIRSAFLSKVSHCHLEKMQVILQNMKARYTLWTPIMAKLFVPASVPSCCCCQVASVVSDSVWPIDGSPPGSPVSGILQARTLEWVAVSFSNAWKWKVKVKSLSCAQVLATAWTEAFLAPLSMGFSRQEYWIRVPLPSSLCPYSNT